MSTTTTWVFGYGSLVSPASMARTIGRTATPGEIAVAQLDGYGRRWNYGAGQVRCSWVHRDTTVDDGVMVALGLEASTHESVNGVAVLVDDDDLAGLDRRERNYDRTDVTDLIRFDDPVPGVASATPTGVRVVTYVPRASAVERYLAARDQQRAAIRQDYWDLVDGAFASLGDRHLEQYRNTAPPDIPVVEMTWSLIS